MPKRSKPKGRGKAAKGKRKGKEGGAAPAVEFDHLFVGTSSFAEAWRFWTHVVGLEGRAQWGNPVYAGTLGAGASSITVAQGEEGPYEELGYEVKNGRPQVYMRAASVDKLHRAMVKRGAKVLRGPLTTHYGARCFSVEGPDGMVVVFEQAR
jgi:hypothetical protein